LQIERHFGDLVEQQRAAVRAFEHTFAGAQRAREAATLVAEQLGFDERRGDRRAVDRDERLARARTHRMDGLGDELLAAAALAADQDGRIRRRHAPDELAYPLDRWRLTDQPEHAVALRFDAGARGGVGRQAGTEIR
jgi:hypothetical protein